MARKRGDDSLGGTNPQHRKPARFTTTGLEAVNATKALISLAVWAAGHRKVEVGPTERWKHFCDQWLPAAPSLGR
jgi:hypothetical protein